MFDFSNYNCSHFEYMVHIFYLSLLNDGWYSYPNFSRFFYATIRRLAEKQIHFNKMNIFFRNITICFTMVVYCSAVLSFLLCILINRCIALFSKTCINFSLLANVIRIARNLIYSDTSKNFTNIK